MKKVMMIATVLIVCAVCFGTWGWDTVNDEWRGQVFVSDMDAATNITDFDSQVIPEIYKHADGKYYFALLVPRGLDQISNPELAGTKPVVFYTEAKEVEEGITVSLNGTSRKYHPWDGCRFVVETSTKITLTPTEIEEGGYSECYYCRLHREKEEAAVNE